MAADAEAADSGLERLTAGAMAARLDAGDIRSEALVGACLGRIAAREDEVGAWAHLDPAAALAAARRADLEPRRGPLHGIPVGIKDIIDTADMPTEYGSAAYAGHRPAADAACVALLREAGAVVLGKTVTTEFAAVTPGKTRNPRNPARSPGGSSSGSAAAVADFMVPLALGTQTVGSTVRPSSYCGAVGFKPSWQTFSLAGVGPQAESLDTLGLMARCVDDILLLGEALLGGFVAAVPGLDRPLRIGVARSPHWPQAEPSTVRILDEAVALFRAAGAGVADCDAADGFDDALAAHWTILSFEFARVLSFERTQCRDRLSAALLDLLDGGMRIPLEDYRAALGIAEFRRSQIARAFDRFDVLLTPAAAGEAPRDPRTPSDLLFQRLWTVLRLPAITLPGFSGPAGLPVGLQLVGPAG
ncbi:MAG: amidase, partial [Rhodospirillaceae bacterium]